jgi:anti-sigma B factor antagonist
MQIAEHIGVKFITLTPVGDLDANSSMQMDEKIQNGIDRDVFHFHIDCSGLRYISSAGLGVFISFMEALTAHGGRFVFSGMAENVYKVFQLLGLEQLMTIVATREEADKMLGA